MLKEELKSKISGLLPTAIFEEGTEPSPDSWLNIQIASAEWVAFAEKLREDESLAFDFLFCVTCIDWWGTPTGKDVISMVYHLTSTIHKHNIVVKVKLNRAQPEIGTVCQIWRTAEFHEREAYEMFGVNFMGHPDLRLLILPEGWEGKNPMRKDFEDPVNMIKL